MSRWTWTVALAALLALGALAALAAVAGPAEDRATLAQRIAAELRCPDCQALSVAESQTRAAGEIRTRIDSLLAEGRSEDEVIAYFRTQYGDGILLSPTTPWPWLVPLAALLVGTIALLVWRRSMQRVPEPAGRRDLDGDARSRARDEAEALDA